MNESMSDKGNCRTALATRGLSQAKDILNLKEYQNFIICLKITAILMNG